MADGEVYQCSVCFFTSDDLPFFLRHLCVDEDGNIAPPNDLIGKLIGILSNSLLNAYTCFLISMNSRQYK